MFDDKITVMIVPRGQGELKQFAVSIKVLWAAGVFGVCFVLLNLFLLADYFDKRVDHARMAQLVQENQTLAQRYASLEESLSGLKNDYGELVAKEEAIRTIFDLPSIDPEARMLGVGGPTYPESDSTTTTGLTASRVTTDVDGLLRLAKFELSRYEEIYGLLADRRDRLDHTPSIMPTKGYLSRGFGYQVDPFTGFNQFHSGLDIANRTGTPIYAPADGKVASVSVFSGLGKMIVIDHGYGLTTRYGHLSGYEVKVGQMVKRGDIIGRVGSTGYSTGPHLHYEVLVYGKPVNPLKYIINR
jgi:murein DD-endopeptidase MepM/ murein hydrolase activator NlpD